MADQAKVGRAWDDVELDAIVTDYFSMLQAELAGQAFVKAHHAAALMDEIGRTHRSVEFKHMNISAVLSELGLPTIRGYKSKPNYQNAIFGAVDRYLGTHPEVLELGEARSGVSETGALFEVPPPGLSGQTPRPAGLERLVRKFDPVERDFRNRALGKEGERLVIEFERYRLQRAERPDLARRVRWVSQEDGDGAGFDVLTFDVRGSERLVEVKTTRGPITTPFILTRNEHALSEERPDAFRLFRVYEFGEAPRLFRLKPPLGESVVLDAESYRASFA